MVLPIPEPGLVISYSYLWRADSAEDNEDGSKTRPCVLVVMFHDNRVWVVPITHTKPADIGSAIELPSVTKKRLGLDEKPQWIICDEVNEFIWPGPDIRPVSTQKRGQYSLGVIPPKLLECIKTKIQYYARGRKFKIIRT